MNEYDYYEDDEEKKEWMDDFQVIEYEMVVVVVVKSNCRRVWMLVLYCKWKNDLSVVPDSF